MAETCRQVLKDCGVSPERLSLKWASASEGPRYVQMVTEYVRHIKTLGSLGSAEGEAGQDALTRLDAAGAASAVSKIRTAYGNMAKKFHEANNPDAYTPEAMETAVREKVMPGFREERLGQEVLMRLGAEGIAGSLLCGLLGAKEDEFEKVMTGLVKKGKVKAEGEIFKPA